MDLIPGDHEPPTPAQLADFRRRMGPPDNEVPGALAWVAVLGRTDDVAVALVGAAVYSSGLRLDIAVRSRGAGAWPVMDGLHGAGRDKLLLGVEYPDGRTASNAGAFASPWPLPEVPDDEPSLTVGSSSATDGTVDAAFYLCPVPPAGPLTVVCAWPGRGITETRTTLDASGLVTAPAQVQQLWPPQDRSPFDTPPEPPDIPDGGWFARNR